MFEDAKKIFMNKTYSVTLGHIQIVSKLADELSRREGKNISDGEVVRRAVDLLYAATNLAGSPDALGVPVTDGPLGPSVAPASIRLGITDPVYVDIDGGA